VEEWPVAGRALWPEEESEWMVVKVWPVEVWLAAGRAVWPEEESE